VTANVDDLSATTLDVGVCVCVCVCVCSNFIVDTQCSEDKERV